MTNYKKQRCIDCNEKKLALGSRESRCAECLERLNEKRKAWAQIALAPVSRPHRSVAVQIGGRGAGKTTQARRARPALDFGAGVNLRGL